MQSSGHEEEHGSSGFGDNQEVDNQPKKRRRYKSVIWEHYKKEIISGVLTAICNDCGRRLKARPENGTSSLRDHQIRCPGKKNDAACSGVNSKASPTIAGYTVDPEILRMKITRMIILHEYPLSMVEHDEFLDVFKYVAPMYKMVSRNTLRADILQVYADQKQKTMKVIESSKGRISITTDLWTASNQKRGYMTVTAHFIDNSWDLRSRILRFMHLPCPHDAVTLADALNECLMDWNVDRRLCTLTVDNCTTNDAMVTLVKGKLDFALPLGGKLFHMRCCAHILNLIVKDGMEVFKDGIERIRDSVYYWSSGPKRVEKFEETARRLMIPCSKKLSLDCVTRWNSTYTMLNIALMYRDVFPRLKQRDPLYKSLPSEEDWILAKELCDKLVLFNQVTELFSGTKYPTSNLVFPKLCEIKTSIKKWMSSDRPYIKDMSIAMMSKFEKYWQEIHGIMAIATVLDPRYKFRLIEYYFPQIYGEESFRQLHRIRTVCYDLERDYRSSLGEVHLVGDMLVASMSENSSVVSYDDHLADYDKYVSTTCRTEHDKSELDVYLDEPVLPRTPDFDILNYWKATGLKYPILNNIARDILAVPVTTVASESSFSTGGRCLGPHRARLHPTTLEALICSQNWLYNEKEFGQSHITLSNEDVEPIDIGEPNTANLYES